MTGENEQSVSNSLAPLIKQYYIQLFDHPNTLQ